MRESDEVGNISYEEWEKLRREFASLRQSQAALASLVLPSFSRPPGATIPPNQGVGMGEGEKVAQDGAEEVRDDVSYLLERARIRMEEAISMLRRRAAPRPPCDCPHEMRSDCATCNPHPSPDGAYEGRPGQRIFWSHRLDTTSFDPNQPLPVVPEVGAAADEVSLNLFLRLAERWLPEPGTKWLWDPPDPKYRAEVEINAVRWNGEEFWIETSYSKDGVSTTTWNDLERFLEVAKPCTPDTNQPPELCEPPAPPPSVEPAEETSSGGERCGEGTAGGAGSCCEGMRVFLRRVLPIFGELMFKPPPAFDECPWCGERIGGER